MLSSHLSLHRRLDELTLDALGPPAQLPVKLASDSDMSIEVIYEDEAALDELEATGRFVRFSAPYERVEISTEEMPAVSALAVTFSQPRPTTFVRTLSASGRAITATDLTDRTPQTSATVPFERVWFDDDEDKLAAIEETPVEAKTSWWWLAISIAVGGAAVVWMASLA